MSVARPHGPCAVLGCSRKFVEALDKRPTKKNPPLSLGGFFARCCAGGSGEGG